MIEISLFIDKSFDFQKFIETYGAQLNEKYSDYLRWYCEAIQYGLDKNKDKLKEHIISKVDRDSTDIGRNKIGDTWHYQDARELLDLEPPGECLFILYKVIDFLEGTISAKELVSFLNELD